MKGLSFLLPWLLSALVSCPLASGAVKTLNPSKDNTLYESATGFSSNGAGDSLFVGATGTGGIRRGLLAFDVAGNIPAGSTVSSVSLTLYMSRTISGAQPVELHRVVADWGEGTSNASGNEGAGAPATTGDATWRHRFFNTTFWTTEGGDFSPTVSAVRSVASVGSYTWGTSPQLVTDVQGWLNNPSSNFGWVLIGSEAASQTAKRFGSRENPMPSARPVLTINYTSLSSPPVITLLGDNPVTLEVGTPYVEPGYSAIDAEDGNITANVVVTGAVNHNVLGSYTLRYNVSDSGGNPAIEKTRVVHVVDTTPPTITLLGENPVTLEVGTPFVEPGYTAADNYDGDLTADVLVIGSVNHSVPGAYALHYNVADSGGNPAEERTRTVYVIGKTSVLNIHFTIEGTVLLEWSNPGVNFVHTVEYRDSLSGNDWSPVPPLDQWPVPETTWIDASASEHSVRFYRVRTEALP